MNAKTWIPLSAAAVLGTGAAYVGYTLVSQTPVHVAARAVKMGELLIAARDVPAGTKLAADDLRTMSVKAETMPQGFAATPDAAVGRVVTEPLHAGQPVGEALLAAPDTPAGLAAILPKGYRAITVALDRSAGVAEFLKPESRVDVVSGFREGEEMSVHTVAQNLRVLAVDGLLAGQKKPEVDGNHNDPPASTSSVTLMVTLEQAAAIDLATTLGKPRLTLRAGGDRELSPFEGLSLAQLRGMTRRTGDLPPEVRPEMPRRDPVAVAPWMPTQPVSTPATAQVPPSPSTRPTVDPFARSERTTSAAADDGEWPHSVRYVEIIRGGVVTHEPVPTTRPSGPIAPTEPRHGVKAATPPAAPPAAPEPQHEYVGNDTRPATE